jgi:UDP-N-acetylglucosamine 2-epimerase (hydrolysing)
MTKSLLFVTGTRADFGKIEPLAVAARDAGYDIAFFVTGMHMMQRYGLTKVEVHRVQGATVHEFQNQREDDPQDLILAKTVMGFSDYLTEAQPDLVVVHGDRVEALAAALVCATNYVRCAHVEGGEVSGTIDEIFRHCNTKLAYCHLVSSDQAARRVMALGEPAEAIHAIGSPELDFHGRDSGVSIDEVRSHYDIPYDDYGVCTFHPVTSEAATMGQQAADLFGAMEASGRNFVVILPNNDPGAADILKVIESLPRDRFRLIPSMRFAHFSELMKHASAILGNSSAGVREAPFLGIPSLDVGTRQARRSDAVSVTSVQADNRAGILGFLSDEWGKRYETHTGFGAGNTAGRFVELLNDPQFWNRSLQKEFQDIG